MSKIFILSGVKGLSSHIQENSLLMVSEESILSINIISQCGNNYDELYLRNDDGSSSVWEYMLPVQHFGNIYNCTISNNIYKQLTQKAIG